MWGSILAALSRLGLPRWLRPDWALGALAAVAVAITLWSFASGIGERRGHEAGFTEGRETGRLETLAAYDRALSETLQTSQEDRHAATRAVLDEMRAARGSDGDLDGAALERLCADDANCRGLRLLLDGAGDVEPRGYPADDHVGAYPQRGAGEVPGAGTGGAE